MKTGHGNSWIRQSVGSKLQTGIVITIDLTCRAVAHSISPETFLSSRDLPLHWVLKSSRKMIMTKFNSTQRIQRGWVHDCSGEGLSRLSPLRLHLRRRRWVIRHLLALLLMRHWSLWLLHLLALDLSLLSLVGPAIVAHGLRLLVLGRIALLGVLLLLCGILLLWGVLLRWVLRLGWILSLRWILFLRTGLRVASLLLHLRIWGVGRDVLFRLGLDILDACFWVRGGAAC